MLLVLLAFLLPFLLLLYYTTMNVEAGLLRRRCRQLNRQRISLIKKNTALKNAIYKFSRRETLIPGGLSALSHNSIVRLRIDQSSPPKR